jgi:predicted ferric reductase
MDTALWALGRGTGVAALVLFTVSIVLGVLTRSGRPLPGLPRFAVTLVHRDVSLTATVFLLIHIVSLFFDSYAQLRLVDTVLPFVAAYQPFWQGLGTLAFDLVIAVAVTGALRNVVGRRVFRVVHWGTYVLWPIAVAHAVGTGTDGTSAWFLTLAGVCTAAVVAAVVWRVTSRSVEYSGVRLPHRVKEKVS